MEFNSLKTLKHFLENKVKSALVDDVPNTVREVMQENILREVYLVYSPRRYVRRGNSGGLIAEENIIWNMRGTNTIEVMNVARGSGNLKNDYLSPVIEYGHEQSVSKGYLGYSFPYPSYAYYYPRPFIQATKSQLRKEKNHVKAFQRALSRYGIKSVDK